MPYPYADLESALGRPLTADERSEAATLFPQSGAPTAAFSQPTVQNAPGFTAPSLTLPSPLTAAPTAVAPTLAAPAPYEGLTKEELYADPSYQWRVDQGRKALEASRAGTTLRSGSTMRDLLTLGQTMGSQEYAAADARKRANIALNWGMTTDVFDRNAAAAADARNFNWGVSTDVYDRGVNAATIQNAADLEKAKLEYEPQRATWEAQTAADQRAAELNFDRDWQREIYGKDYDLRKAQFLADDEFRKAVYGTDDAFRKAVQAENDVWKREVMEEERRRFLAELGAQ